MKKIINKYLLLFLCIFSLVLPTGCEVKEQKQVVVDYQEYHFRNENLLESHYEKHGKDMVKTWDLYPVKNMKWLQVM